MEPVQHGHGFQRLWEEQGEIQLKAVTSLLHSNVTRAAADTAVTRCPDTFACLRDYTDALLPLIGEESMEGLRNVANSALTIPWMTTSSGLEDAGESLIRACLTVRRAEHDKWEEEFRTAKGAQSLRRSPMPTARSLIAVRGDATSSNASDSTPMDVLVVGLVTRVTSERGVTFIEALFPSRSALSLASRDTAPAVSSGTKRPRPSDETFAPMLQCDSMPSRWLCWAGPNAVSALREASAVLSLHTYHPAIIECVLHGAKNQASASAPAAGDPRSCVSLPREAAKASDDKLSPSGLLRGLTPQERRFYMPSPAYKAHYLESHFNASQRTAVLQAVESGGITLIQGPPGTGKSTTIIGLLNTMHIAAYNYYNAVLMGRAGAPSTLPARTLTIDEPPAVCVVPRVVQATVLPSMNTGNAVRSSGVATTQPASLQQLLRVATSDAQVDPEGSKRLEPGSVRGIMRWLLYSSATSDECLSRVREAVQLRPRLLVTAPSNAAVDNLVCVLARDGMRGNSLASVQLQPQPLDPRAASTQHLERYRPPIARVGEGASASAVATRLCIEPEVEALLRMSADEVDAWGAALLAERTALVAAIDRIRSSFQVDLAALPREATHDSKRASGRLFVAAAAQILHVVNAFERNRNRLVRHRWLEVLRDGSSDRTFEADVRRELRTSLLEDAEIVLTTTSSAAATTIESFVQSTGHAFEMVVIDEAAQAVEPSTLIPMRYGCVQAVLVGDPAQLPPTVLCRAAAKRGYDRSLFARLADSGVPSHLLDTQYRMHPALSAFPSRHFYGGRIKDAASVRGAGRESPLHTIPCFRHLVFFDLMRARQGFAGGPRAGLQKESALRPDDSSGRPRKDESIKSFSNSDEADFIINLLRALNKWRGRDASGQKIRFSGNVGLLSFYRGQVDLLRHLVHVAFPPKQEPSDAAVSSTQVPLHFPVDINTVDGYQVGATLPVIRQAVTNSLQFSG